MNLSQKLERLMKDFDHSAPTNMRQAAEVLDELGSAQDPIFCGHGKKETTPVDLAYGLEGTGDDDPAKVTVWFYGDIDGVTRLRRGSILSMIVDRLTLRKSRERTPWKPARKICTKCGQEVKK